MADKKSRVWGATGMYPPAFFNINDKNKKHLIEVIRDINPSIKVPDSFFCRIEEVIKQCRGQIEVAQKSSPSSVRKNLSMLSKCYKKLVKAYNQLDGNSHQLISETSENFNHSNTNSNNFELQETIAFGNYIAQQARILAYEYPLKGNLQKHHINILAYETSLAIEDELNVIPSQTKEGIFVGILEIVIGLATGKERKAVHALTASCLKTIKTDDNGVITWEVPNS